MKTKMIDMKQSKTNSNKYELSGDSPYPYGLSLSLNAGSIKKLGLESEDLEIGSTVDFQITVEVTNVSQTAGSKTIDNCTMQIVQMGEIETADDKDSMDDNDIMSKIRKKVRSSGPKNPMDANENIGGIIKE